MAKRLPIDQPIPSLETAWDNGKEAYTGERVENFIKEQFRQRASAFFFDSATMTLLGFESEEDKQTYIETGDERLVITSTPFSFSGTIRQIKVTPVGGSSNLYFTTTQNEAIISVTLVAQEKGLTDSEWTESLEDFRVSVAVDRGASGTYETVRSDVLVLNGNGYEIDVRNYLQSGNNRVKITAEGAQSGEKGTLVLQCYLTTMYLQASNFAWHTPFIEGRPYSLGGMNIGGNLPKTLIVTVSNENGYYRRYEVNIGTTTYINTAYYFSEMEFPSGGTGIYNVEIYVQAEGIESDHLKYNIMCVAAADTMTAQLVAISDIKNPVENYAENSLFKYVCYNGGAATADISVVIRALVNQNPTTIRSNVMEGVATATQHEFILPLEIETEETNLRLDTRLILGECEQQSVVAIGNSRSYPAASGASFYLNPAARMNSDANRELIVNAANTMATPLAAEWTNMTWASDGWTTDSAGRKCLLIPAGSRCVIPTKLLQSNSARSIEIAFKIENISDYNEPAISIYEDVHGAEDYWIGFKAYPTRAILHSNALHSNDLQQSYDYEEGKLTDLIFSIAKPYKSSDYGNIAFIYCNGVKKCTFPFSQSDSFVSNGYIVIGSESADICIYKLRGYDRALEANDACRNFVNSLPTSADKLAAQAKIDEVINDSYKVDYDKVYGKKNTMVVEMLDGAELPHYGLSKEYSARANVDFNFIKSYSYDGHNYASWAFTLGNVEFTGQGSTSMNYWLWNLRMRPDKTKNPGCTITYADGRANTDNKHVLFDPTSDRPTVGRITAKKNIASSPQSHKMGATAAFNALHDEVIGEAADHTCVAVYQEPVYAFQKHPIEGTSQYTYEFIGLYTVGPDKGDKNTFGYNGDDVLALEGLNHNIMGVGYDYPWSELEYVHSNEAICAKKSDGYDKAIEVSQAGSAETQADIAAKLDAEFKPAYELLYNDSTMIVGVEETLDEVNADVNAWRQKTDADGHSYQRYEFWTDGDYRVFYFNIRTSRYEYNGVNLLDQCGIAESELAGKTIAEKNEMFKAARLGHFRGHAADYWDVDDNLFTIAFLYMFGATDNFKKNSYQQKKRRLADGGRWGQRQDDLDTIFKTDNQGLYSKTYSINIFDWTDAAKTAYVFKGEDSRWVRLFVEAFPSEFMEMGQMILASMYLLSSGGNTLDRLKNFFNKHFFDKAQNYFSKSAYNHDAEIAYEEAYPHYVDGSYSVDVSPLAQSKGDATEAEQEWLEKRIVYLCSFFKYGMFGSASDASCGRITFRTQQQQSFTLTPAIDLYPAIAYGESNSKQSAQERVMAGDSVTLNNVGGSNTNVYIMASDWLADIGDLSKLAVDASSDPAIAVSGKRLLKLKVGDENAEEVTSNLAEVRLGSCPSLLEIDARNLSSLNGTVDLSQCPRLRRAYLGGTSIATANVSPGARIEELELPATVFALDLRSLKMLQGFDYSGLTNIGFLRIEDCLGEAMFPLLKQLYNAENSRLKDIRLIGFTYNGDATDTQMLANLANDTDKDGNAHAYNGINSEGSADESLLPVIEGTLNVAGSIYRKDGEAINDNYPRLDLNVEGGYYKWFEDAEVRRVMSAATSIGADGNGITEEKCAALTTFPALFINNTSIVEFNELNQFTALTTLSWGVFNNCSNLESITFPTSITTIGGQAFCGCSKLSMEVNFPNLISLGNDSFTSSNISAISNLGSITQIPNGQSNNFGCFRGCQSLVSASLPSTLNQIGSYAFHSCANLTQVTIHSNNLTTIGYSAFEGCTSLADITLPPSITTISGSAFYGCTSLAIDINLPNLTSLGNDSFMSSGIVSISNLGSITQIPNGQSRNYGCFRGCQSLVSASLPSTLNQIGSYAFHSCANLTQVTIHSNNLTTIGYSAFEGCTSLADITLPPSITTISGFTFYRCTSLAIDVNLPNLTSLGADAFCNCGITRVSNLGSITELSAISDNYGTFLNCTKLRYVELPSTITSICSNAFAGCSLLTTFVCNAATPPTLGYSAFPSATIIYVPDDSVENYKAASNWSSYASRIKGISELPTE